MEIINVVEREDGLKDITVRYLDEDYVFYDMDNLDDAHSKLVDVYSEQYESALANWEMWNIMFPDDVVTDVHIAHSVFVAEEEMAMLVVIMEGLL